MGEYKDKTILITGGTGSFGNSFLEYLLPRTFKEVRIFSRDELKQEQMRIKLSRSDVKFYLGDIRSRESLDEAMHDVDYVFHAAALKQVPSCEFFPEEAVLTNVIGSKNVIESAIHNNVKKVVCLGTDKAVYPINTMGMTKALMEKIAQSISRKYISKETVICSVRYGNVMYSRGSVIPLFIKQMKEGKPITLTEPKMTRFLLQLKDAIELVDYAFNEGKKGEVLVKKAPACSMIDLVHALKSLFNSDVDILNIGMRHGEKLYETLVSREELTKSKDRGDYIIVPMDDRDLNYNLYYTEGDKDEINQEDYTSHNAEQLDIEGVKELLLKLPEVRQELERI